MRPASARPGYPIESDRFDTGRAAHRGDSLVVLGLGLGPANDEATAQGIDADDVCLVVFIATVTFAPALVASSVDFAQPMRFWSFFWSSALS